MHIQPAKVVESALGVLLLQLLEFFVHFVLGQIQKFSVVYQFLYVVVHRRNVSTQQLVDTLVNLVLHFQLSSDTGLSVFLFLLNLNHLDASVLYDPVNCQTIA